MRQVISKGEVVKELQKAKCDIGRIQIDGADHTQWETLRFAMGTVDSVIAFLDDLQEVRP